GNRIVNPALLKKNDAKVQIRITIIGSQFYCVLIVADCFTWRASSGEGVSKIILDECPAKVVMGGSVARANLQRHLEVRNRAVQLAALQEKIAEIVMCRIVVSGNSQRMVPKRLAVFPIRRLYKCAPAH